MFRCLFPKSFLMQALFNGTNICHALGNEDLEKFLFKRSKKQGNSDTSRVESCLTKEEYLKKIVFVHIKTLENPRVSF